MSIRVLHVGKYFPPARGGMENFLKDLLKGLAGEGIHASAIVHHHRRGMRFSVEEQGDVRVFRVPCRGQWVYVPVSPGFPLYLRRVIRVFRPDILHLHLPNVSAFWALVVPEARRIPWVVHWHSDVVPSSIDRRLRLLYRVYRPFEQACLARAERIIGTSGLYINASEPLSRWKSKCEAVPLGLDPVRLPLPAPMELERARKGWPPGKLKVLSIGRLTYYKGFLTLIRAAALSDRIAVRIVGEGGLRRRLESEIALTGISGRVFLEGELPDDELRALLSSCDCLCLPSIERTEAFGLVLLEAMRYGKPVVAGDILGSGVGWVVRRGACGILARPGDPKALQEALSMLEASPSLRNELGIGGSAEFGRTFHIRSVAAQVREVYLRTMTAPKVSPPARLLLETGRI